MMLLANQVIDESLEFLIFLGDFIYEYADNAFADGSPFSHSPEPNIEIFTAEQYRVRYRQQLQC